MKRDYHVYLNDILGNCQTAYPGGRAGDRMTVKLLAKLFGLCLHCGGFLTGLAGLRCGLAAVNDYAGRAFIVCGLGLLAGLILFIT